MSGFFGFSCSQKKVKEGGMQNKYLDFARKTEKLGEHEFNVDTDRS